jgi:hypothetical protein
MHYVGGGRNVGRTESLRQAIRVAQAAGLRVGITFGNGAFIIPADYEFVWAAGGKVALRMPDGVMVIYGPRRRRPDKAARAFVRVSPGYGLDDL